MHQIFAWNIFSGFSSHDIMCNCDITDSPFSENMASLKRLLKPNKKSKHERKVNFSSLDLNNNKLKHFKCIGHIYVSI